jgi:transmembrane sensor
MSASRLEYLFDCYLHQNCSEYEEAELMNLLAKAENKVQFQKLIDELIEKTGTEVQMPDDVAASILKNVIASDVVNKTIVKSKHVFAISWTQVAVAACIILFISSIAYWLFLTPATHKLIATANVTDVKQAPIRPGGNHAILTTADGRTIVLDSIENGNIVNGNSKIKKHGAMLVFGALKTLKEGSVVTYNTLSTPRGGQYQLVLPDGSKVWLNASSSIHFPTAFVGKERNVELTGEAYFEIAKNKEKPFHVNVNGMQVEVLGTHFNVNAYEDEGAIKTSLLEGSVKIKRGAVSGLLKPGQQGVLKKNSNNLEIKSADMNEVIAWKNGLFQFDGADIKTIMREIGRWYDVEIEYAGTVPDRRFEGKISRDAQLSDVLKILELSNMKFSVQGKRIVVQ